MTAQTIRCTLVSEGSSDRALIPLLRRLMEKHFPSNAIGLEWADLARLPAPARSLSERIAKAIELYPCEVLFVHRDADHEPRSKRVDEIENALMRLGEISTTKQPSSVVCTIPVRMLETWLLVDEDAIRKAAGNPRGGMSISLPKLTNLETESATKEKLHELLRVASGLSGRKLKKFKMAPAVHRVAEFMEDLTPLFQLSAFRDLEQEIKSKCVCFD